MLCLTDPWTQSYFKRLAGGGYFAFGYFECGLRRRPTRSGFARNRQVGHHGHGFRSVLRKTTCFTFPTR